MQNNTVVPYAPAVLKLLGGVLSHDDTATWNLLLLHQAAVQDYFARIGLQVTVSEADGYAFLHQPEVEDAEGQRVTLPRLTRRDRLSYHVTLLCVLLRERLDQWDASTPDDDALRLSAEDMRDMMQPFLRERGNQILLNNKVNATVTKVVELGFLRRQTVGGEERWEVRRIIRARIHADKLAEIKAILVQHGDTDTTSE